MPANLNALIRYKTINSCLYGGRRKWTIGELITSCSEALDDARGRKSLISERTIRDDIRVMRSDILGYNAPIVQQKGLYFYSDPHYSIMSINITDSGLAGQIISFLVELKATVSHPELERILERLMGLKDSKSVSYLPGEVVSDKPEIHADKITDKAELSKPKQPSKDILETLILENMTHYQATKFQNMISFLPVPPQETTWGDIFRVISSMM